MMHQIVLKSSTPGLSKNLIWLTDLHLDANKSSLLHQFLDLVKNEKAEGVLIGGDISNGITSLTHLRYFAKYIDKPIYFVLGNHDYYHSSIANIRNLAGKLHLEFPNIHYLTTEGIAQCTQTIAIIGHDGWADGRAGNFLTSDIMLHDYLLIEELTNLTSEERLKKLNHLGMEAAQYLRERLLEAFKTYEKAILLTHTPPFRQACLYKGKACDDNWAPHFVCQTLGEYLIEIAQAHPQKDILVLSGHSHNSSDIQILPNLRILVGHSELGTPSIQGTLHIS